MSSSSAAAPSSRLRERLLSSLSKSNVSKAGKLVAAPAASSVAALASAPAARPVSKQPKTSVPPPAPAKKTATAAIDRPPQTRRPKKDQPQRLLKRLPQAKVLGDVDLEKLMKENDLVVVMTHDADEIGEQSTFDASVADEKDGLKRVLKSALLTSPNKLSKKVLFLGGEREGGEVSAIYLYEAIPIDVPWHLPKIRPETKATKPAIANPMATAMAFRAC
eukprot:Gregarina_sp_Pseudo_9__1729@NODE_2172_length_1115_cov_102_077138_g2000_i0_p1_GENE_NODE_2172_length_1115_cov_102_077138_g2000_i0NODE_2172_length_1115_cov_102_077138_g2000_i0_p1_ORF_typecomplete_len220_score29_93Med3/PF11593_8/0_2_NODE_2172_length_1115_cov_102_077138_g2000_i0270929